MDVASVMYGDGAVALSAFAFPPTAFSFSVWFRGYDNAGPLFHYFSASPTADVSFFATDASTVQLTVAGSGINFPLNTYFTSNVWHHFVVAWKSLDGATAVYYDGFLAGTGFTAANYVIPAGGCFTLQQRQTVSCGGFSPGSALFGDVAEPSLFSSPLLASDVAALKAGAAAITFGGLVFAWRLASIDAASLALTSWIDAGALALHGSVVGTAGGVQAYGGTTAQRSTHLRVMSCGLNAYLGTRNRDSLGFVAIDGSMFRDGMSRGVTLWAWEPDYVGAEIGTGRGVIYEAVFDTCCAVDSALQASSLAAAINALPDGALVALTCQDECNNNLANAKATIRTTLGSTKVRTRLAATWVRFSLVFQVDTLAYRDSFALIAVKNGNEIVEASSQASCVTVTWPYGLTNAVVRYGGGAYGVNGGDLIVVSVAPSGAVASSTAFDLMTSAGVSALSTVIASAPMGQLILGASSGALPVPLPQAAVDSLRSMGLSRLPSAPLSSWAFVGSAGAVGGSGTSKVAVTREFVPVGTASGFITAVSSWSIADNARPGDYVGVAPVNKRGEGPYVLSAGHLCGSGAGVTPVAIDAVSGRMFVVAPGFDATKCAAYSLQVLAFGDTWSSGWIAMSARGGAASFREFTHTVGGVPVELLLVRVYVRVSSGPNAGFVFSSFGGGPQGSDRISSGDNNCGGVVYAYSKSTVRIWLPSASSGGYDNGGFLINIPWNYGGGTNAQQSLSGDVQVSVAKDQAPDYDSGWFLMRAQSKGSGRLASYMERAHGLGALPSRVKVLVRCRGSGTSNDGFVMEGMATAQTDDAGGGRHGGVVYVFSDKTVRLWAPEASTGTAGGRMWTVSEGWAASTSATYSSGGDVADVRVMAWSTERAADYASPPVQVNSGTSSGSFMELSHGLQTVPARVSISIVLLTGPNAGYVSGAIGMPQGGRYANGLVAAYDATTIRIWVPSDSSPASGNYVAMAAPGWGGELNALRVRLASVSVRAWTVDPSVQVDSTLVSLKVVSVPRAPDGTSVAVELPSTVKVGSIVGNVHSTAPSLSVVQYRIAAGNEDGVFEINSASGDIFIASTKLIDPSKTPRYVLAIEVTDYVWSDFVVASFALTKLNTPPILVSATVSVREDCAPGGVVGPPINVTNVERGETILFTIMGGIPTAAPFKMSACSGQLRLADKMSLNYRAVRAYDLFISVADDGTPPLNSTGYVHIDVLRVNHAPICAPQSLFAPENVVGGRIGYLVASDPDNDTLTWSITVGNDAGSMFVNASTGELRVAAERYFDFEKTPSYFIGINAVDNGDPVLSCSTQLSVRVTDANDPPTISTRSLTMAENCCPMVPVQQLDLATTVTFADQDVGQSVRFELVPFADAARFSISPAGVVKVAATSYLNFEVVRNHTIRVNVTDSGGASTVADLVIFVTDQNDPPQVTLSGPGSMREHAPAGTFAGITVSVSDEDVGDIFSLSVQPQSSPFVMRGTEVVMGAGEWLHVELSPFVVASVVALDRGVPPSQGSTVLNVTITAVAHAPELRCNVTAPSVRTDVGMIKPCFVYTVVENTRAGTVVAQLPTRDMAGDTISCGIVGGNPGGGVSVSSGCALSVARAAALDFETRAVVPVVIRVSDGRMSSDVTIAVLVSNELEAPGLNDTWAVMGRVMSEGAYVAQLSAPDPQGWAVGFALLGVAPSSVAGLFELSASGALRLTRAHSAAAGRFTLIVAASNGVLAVNRTVTVDISATASPPVVASPQRRSVLESAVAGTLVGQPVEAVNVNVGTMLLFALVSSDVFAISSTTGQLSVRNASLLDAVRAPVVNVTVLVSDSGVDHLTSATTVVVRVAFVARGPACAAIAVAIDENPAVNAVVAETPCVRRDDLSEVLLVSDGYVSAVWVNSSLRISVKNSTLFDFESVVGHVIFAEVRITGMHVATSTRVTSTIRVAVQLRDVIEAPRFSDCAFTVSEGVVAGTVIGQLVLDSDPDKSAITVFGVTDSVLASSFLIDSEGRVVVTDPRALDYESHPYVSLTVSAIRGSLRTVRIALITITDVNDLVVTGVSMSSKAGLGTSGGDVFTLHGLNLASAWDANSPLSVLYGPTGTEFVATGCRVAMPPTEIECTAAAGHGGRMRAVVRVGRGSSNSSAGPITGLDYAPPQVTHFGGNATSLSTSGGDSIFAFGTNMGADATSIVMTYRDPRDDKRFLYISRSCRVILPHIAVACVAIPGVGMGLDAFVTVDGQASAIVVGALQYAAPVVTGLDAPMPLRTSGGATFSVNGRNFGFVSEAGGLGGGSFGARTLSVTYGPRTGAEFVAQCGHVAQHTRLTCVAAPGWGASLLFVVSVAGVVGNYSSALAYSAPTITRVQGEGSKGASTRGGQRVSIVGTDFGTVGGEVTYGRRGVEFVAVACSVAVPHSVFECLTATGHGAGHVWTISVGGQRSPVFAANTSYGAPVVSYFTGVAATAAATRGHEQVSVHGANFGDEDAAITSVSYRFVRGTSQYDFVAASCIITVPHETLRCLTAPGAGADLKWRVVIDGLESVHPVTAYARPSILTLQSERLRGASTYGGDTIDIIGDNFGPPGLFDGAFYGRSGLEYNATGCEVRDHTRITCTSVPGVGVDLRWRVLVASQWSEPSADTFSYAAPLVLAVTPNVTRTQGGAVVEVSGTNFALADSGATWRILVDGLLPPLVAGLIPVRPDAPGIAAVGTAVYQAGYRARGLEYVQFIAPPGFGTGMRVSVVVSSGGSQVTGASPYSFAYAPPMIVSANPRLAEEGAAASYVLQVLGSDLCAGPACGKVFVGDADGIQDADMVDLSGAGVEYTDDRVSIPIAAPFGRVFVRVGGVGEANGVSAPRDSNVLVFTSLAPMLPKRISQPYSSVKFATSGGETLVLMGCYFVPAQTSVTVGGVPCVLVGDVVESFKKDAGTDPACDNPNWELRCLVPAGVGTSNDVVIMSSAGQTSADSSASVVQVLRYAEPSANTVIDGATGAVLSHPGAAVGSLVFELPTVGGVVEVHGSNFGIRGFVSLSNGAIMESQSDSILVWNHSRVVVVVPPGEGSSVVFEINQGSLRTPGGPQRPLAATTLRFQRPIVTRIWPLHGRTAGGTIVTLWGANFGVVGPRVFLLRAGANLQDAPCALADARRFNHTVLSCVLPAGEGAMLVVRVIVGDQSVDAPLPGLAFSYDAPVVLAVHPARGGTAGGEPVTIVGCAAACGGVWRVKRDVPRCECRDNFGLTGTALLDNGRGRQVPFRLHNASAMNNHTHMQLSVPEGDGVAWAVVVTARGQSSPSVGRLFNYDPPVIVSVSPRDSPTRGGTTFTFVGYNFGVTGVTLRVGGRPCAEAKFVHTAIQCVMPAGLGHNLSVVVHVAQQRNVEDFMFSYQPARIYAGRPNTPDAEGQHNQEFLGVNFGMEATPVRILVGGRECPGATWLNDNAVRCNLGRDVVGAKNVSITVANQTNFFGRYDVSGALYSNAATPLIFETECKRLFYGRNNELCLECPMQSATCLASREYPEPYSNPGWWQSALVTPNSLCSVERLRRDTCPFWVPCEPKVSCVGNNTCALGYMGARCGFCLTGSYYRLAGQCVRCPDNPWLIVIAFVAGAVGFTVLGWVLNRKQVNIGVLSIGIDYFQVLAMFARSQVPWPEIIRTLFTMLSVFNFNLELAVPECAIPTFGAKNKWFFVEALPLCACALFGILHVVLYLNKRCILRSDRRYWHSHVSAMISSQLVMLYVLYLYITRTTLDVFNCSPTDPPDGHLYLEIVFEECGVQGGVQLALLPYAIVSLVLYTVAYPLGVYMLLWRNKNTVKIDQVLRCADLGATRTTSTGGAYELRRLYGRLYYQFRPGKWYWQVLIVFRKFMIAFASLMYRRTPSYQLATALLVLFIAFGLQVRHTPYLSHGDHHEVLASMKQKEAVSASHRALVSTINAAIAHSAARTSKSSSWRGVSLSRDAMRQNVVVAAKLLSDYNIVESVLLASAVMVALAGVMFASGRFEQEAAESQSGYLAAATAGLIILTIIYFCAVLVVDASPQCAGILARCAPRLFLTKREVARAGDTAGADARGQGGGPVEMAVMENPLVSRAAAAASKNTTPDGTGGGGATAAIAVLQAEVSHLRGVIQAMQYQPAAGRIRAKLTKTAFAQQPAPEE